MSREFNYKMVIFDVDGTILDTSSGLSASIIRTIEKFKMKMLDNETINSFIGPPVQESFKKYYGLTDNEAQKMAETFRTFYKELDLLKAVPYDNVFELFDLLKEKKITIAIATYKREDYAIELMKHFHFNDYTSIIYGADNYNKLKKSDIIQKCIESSDFDAKDILVVGDSLSDGEGANKNSCDFCGVTYGFGTKLKSDYSNVNTVKVVNSINEIIAWIQQN